MKKISLFAAVLYILVGCCNNIVPSGYTETFNTAMKKAGDKRSIEFKNLMSELPESKIEAGAFLISYMPQRDLDSLSIDMLRNNINAAYDARERFAWSKEIPDSIFLNDVLPYVSLNEERDDWRADFLSRFTKYVEGCSTLKEAIYAMAKNIYPELKVEYNTKREKPDQNPSESLRQGMASCSGLSIIAVDAMRSVGIPARIAGAANWHDNRGNHNWCEVWLDGQWHFFEYYFDDLDKSWFLADAGKAKANDKLYAIWASSFKPTKNSGSFPLVWDYDINYVHAVNVTERYVNLYKQSIKTSEKAGGSIVLEIVKYKDGKDTGISIDRIATNIDVFMSDKQIGGGRTASATQDMNDGFRINVPANSTITIKYTEESGVSKTKDINTKDKDIKIII